MPSLLSQKDVKVSLPHSDRADRLRFPLRGLIAFLEYPSGIHLRSASWVVESKITR